MRIKCNQCQQEFGQHRAAAGIFTLVPAAVITAIACAILACIIHGWACLLALPLWLFLSWVLFELPRWFTSLRYRRRHCPSCGARDWSRPHYSGFGL